MRHLALFFALSVSITGCAGGDDDDTPSGVDAGTGEACDGCLDGDTCLAGTSPTACGEDGLTCTACLGDEVCQAGECVVPEEPDPEGCGPDNCDGCCDGDSCMSGSSGASCGGGGDMCVDCGPRAVCDVGECIIDPDSRWDLIAVGAVVPETNAGGGTWDAFGGAPDLFAKAFADDTELEVTSTVSDTLVPVWNEPIALDIPASALGDLVFEVIDNDVDADDSVGLCYVGEPGASAFDGEVIRYHCPSEVAFDIDLRFVPH